MNSCVIILLFWAFLYLTFQGKEMRIYFNTMLTGFWCFTCFSQRFPCFFFVLFFFRCAAPLLVGVVVPPEGSGRDVFLVVRVDALAVVSLLCCIKQMRIVAASYYPLAAALCGNHHVTISAFRQFTRNTENGGNHGNNAPPWPERVFFWLCELA